MPKNPHANFTPNFDGYSGQEPFRFWCQLALPLTYDDSLSYYELLNKVVNYLNHVIADVSAVEGNVGKLRDAFVELQDYVNEYFDELDVESELRNTLNNMALDGSFQEILLPLVEETVGTELGGVVEEQIDGVVERQIGDVVENQIGDVVAEQLPPILSEEIPESVTDWLDENVNPVGSAVIVDNTLKISGAAADAKITGEKLSDLSEDVKHITGSIGFHEWSKYTDKKYIDLSGDYASIVDGEFVESIGSGNVRYLIVEAIEGDVFTISTKGGGASRAYAFVANSGEILEVANASVTISAQIKVAPYNTKYLVVNDTQGTGEVYYGVTAKTLENRIANSFSFDAVDPSTKSITPNDDLNDFIVIGNYKKTGTTGAPANCPVGNSITFALKVMNAGLLNSYMQLLIPNAPSTGYIWYRIIGTSGGATSYGNWHKITDERVVETLTNDVEWLNNNAIKHNRTIITKNNVSTYFPNSSFNDAEPNSIYLIAEYLDMDETPVILDAPPGDQVFGVPVDQSQTPSSPVKKTGSIRGTLFTYYQDYDEDATGLTQIFIAYPGYKNYYGAISPSISFRVAYYENDEYHWSEWSKISERGVVHSGNGIVYGGEPYINNAPFTDLNDAPWNGIYHIDRNMNGSDESHTLGHHPIPGQSCMVVTMAFSPTFNHARTQIVYALNGKMFWRYEYLDHGQNWTRWYEVATIPSGSNIIYNKGALANGSDLNNIFENSIYMLNAQTNANYVHNPTSAKGFITIKQSGEFAMQTVESTDGNSYKRYSEDGGTTWSNWS